MAEVATRTSSQTDASPDRVRQRRFTRDEYFRMTEADVLGPEDQVELVNGYLIEMTAQNAPHRATVVDGTKLLVHLLRDNTYSVQVHSTLPLDCKNVPEPDFAIFRGSGSDLLEEEPEEVPLIIEVADTTLTYDRTSKLACYASNDIPEYWIVNLRDQVLEVYADPSGDEYRERRTLERGENVTPRFKDTLELVVADLLPAPPEGGE